MFRRIILGSSSAFFKGANEVKTGIFRDQIDLAQLVKIGTLCDKNLERLIDRCEPIIPHAVLALQFGRSLAHQYGWDIHRHSYYPSIFGFYGHDDDELGEKSDHFGGEEEYDEEFFMKNEELSYQLLTHWSNLIPKLIKSYRYFHQGFWKKKYLKHAGGLQMNQSQYFDFALTLFDRISPGLNRVLKGMYEEFGIDNEFKVDIFYERIRSQRLPRPTLHVYWKDGKQVLAQFKFYEEYSTRILIECPKYRRVRNVGKKEDEEVKVTEFKNVGKKEEEEVKVKEFKMQPLEPYNPKEKLWTV